MAKTNYPEELVALVEEYLTDGIITDKERQVLLKKAQQLGVDADEFDLYIDAQQQKADQIFDAAAAKKRGKTCPFCGGTVPQLADKCPHCGETITADASEELQEIFNHLEEALVNLKSGNEIDKSKATVERYTRKAKMFYENNPKVQKLLAEVQEESDKAEAAAKKSARNKTIFSILTYNKKLTAAIVVGLIIVIIWGISAIWSAIKGPDPTDMADDPQATIEAVNTAINADDLAKAEAYCAAYQKEHGYGDIMSAYNAIANAYAEKGEYDKALANCKGLADEYASDPSPIRVSIQEKCIKAGDYDKAEKCINYWGSTDEYFDFLCKCIDDMKEKGNTSKVKSFIDRKVSHYDSNLTSDEEWQQAPTKKRLYKYAGI